jgi:hypothetical protein
MIASAGAQVSSLRFRQIVQIIRIARAAKIVCPDDQDHHDGGWHTAMVSPHTAKYRPFATAALEQFRDRELGHYRTFASQQRASANDAHTTPRPDREAAERRIRPSLPGLDELRNLPVLY